VPRGLRGARGLQPAQDLRVSTGWTGCTPQSVQKVLDCNSYSATLVLQPVQDLQMSAEKSVSQAHLHCCAPASVTSLAPSPMGESACAPCAPCVLSPGPHCLAPWCSYGIPAGAPGWYLALPARARSATRPSPPAPRRRASTRAAGRGAASSGRAAARGATLGSTAPSTSTRGQDQVHGWCASVVGAYSGSTASPGTLCFMRSPSLLAGRGWFCCLLVLATPLSIFSLSAHPPLPLPLLLPPSLQAGAPAPLPVGQPPGAPPGRPTPAPPCVCVRAAGVLQHLASECMAHLKCGMSLSGILLYSTV